uniref:Uncharacterized protein n=1 Tax=Panthera leo TaxID=9689 RepID=A0A8C8XZB6_PANLE
MWTADEIARLCYEHYQTRLPKQGKPEPNREWTLLAAVVKIQPAIDQACGGANKPVQVTKEVVSMGTGTKCIGQSKMRKSGKPRWGLETTVHVVFSSSQRRGRMAEVANLNVPADCHSRWKDRTHFFLSLFILRERA